MDTWFLLEDGSSPDGRGRGKYVGRTTDKQKALKHFMKVRKSPYSTGRVLVVTDKKMFVASNTDDIFP